MLEAKKDLLPDSRAKVTRGRIFTANGAWIPVFCANCGKEGGSCPEENMTFMFYLCPSCFESKGAITNTMAMPDEVFWARVRDEQLEAHGRILNEHELAREVSDGTSALAKLILGGH